MKKCNSLIFRILMIWLVYFLPLDLMKIYDLKKYNYACQPILSIYSNSQPTLLLLLGFSMAPHTPFPLLLHVDIIYMGGTTLGPGGQWPPLFFLKKYYYIYVLILTILFYKFTSYFSLTISLILLRVILYSQTFL